MEAIAAFSLAANILPFFEFVSKLISLLWGIYFSGTEGVEELDALRKTNQDLRHFLANFPQLDTSDSMYTLFQDCRQLGQELEASLDKLSGTEKIKKREAFKTAIKLIWKEDQIRSIQTRLDGFRAQLTLHLLNLLR